MLAHPTTWTNAQRSETRVKERTRHLPPAQEWRLDGTPPSSRVKPMKNSSRRNHLHNGTSHSPDLRFQKTNRL
ncbi:hypothetical protein DY000_02039701 [Brassica cretica]|uniref:DUF4005 domain-containing protein n=1 Tax=Brassica cretica TaxID=69181 RepID=A0ABQ7BJW3_BRACR|nr:hypothetical protein DY000_02039701 [Brassica cretica]